jgi:hypothetical protein
MDPKLDVESAGNVTTPGLVDNEALQRMRLVERPVQTSNNRNNNNNNRNNNNGNVTEDDLMNLMNAYARVHGRMHSYGKGGSGRGNNSNGRKKTRGTGPGRDQNGNKSQNVKNAERDASECQRILDNEAGYTPEVVAKAKAKLDRINTHLEGVTKKQQVWDVETEALKKLDVKVQSPFLVSNPVAGTDACCSASEYGSDSDDG